MGNKKNEKLGEERCNNKGCLMKIIEYNSNKDIIVEFQDCYKAKVHTAYNNFIKGLVKNPYYRLEIEKLNNQNCLMKIIEYKKSDDIIVEFQDEYKAKVHAAYREFENGTIKTHIVNLLLMLV